ncbi:MAG: hypothetical protein AAGA21_03200 [Pseudomonadota bacterium]
MGTIPTPVELATPDSIAAPSETSAEAPPDIVALLPPSDGEMSKAEFGARPSVFLIPFDVPDEGEREQRLAEELHDDIVSILSRSSDIAVIGRKAREWSTIGGQSVRSLERELGARYAISGDLTVRDGRVRFAVHLLETATGGSMWSKNFDLDGRRDNNLLVNQIAGNVASEVLRAEAERTLRQEPERLSAEGLTNRARHSFTAFNRRTFHEIEQLARMAIDLKPSLPGAYGILAGAMAMKAQQAWTEQPDEDLEEAFSEGSRAVELSPGNPRMLFWWGHVHFYGGRTDDAIGILGNAAAGDPSYVPTHILHGAAMVMAGDVAAGMLRLNHALDLAPDHAQAFQAQLWLGIAHFELQEIERAQRAFLASINQNVIKNPADNATTFWAWYGTAATYMASSRSREGQAILDRLRQRFTDHDYAIMLEHAEESFAPKLRELKIVSTVERTKPTSDMLEPTEPRPMTLRNMFRRRASAES